MEPDNAFAQNVRRVRKERGLSQERLALDAGLLLPDIGEIETQGREPGVRIVAKIARALHVDPGELFKGFDPD